MIHTDVLILGGGLAGLSTAYHLDRLAERRADSRLSYLIVERGLKVGGLASSVSENGFTFDHTGHLLHLHDPYGKRLILDLLKGNLALHERHSWIFSQGAYTRYPFQANTFGLPPQVVEDCVVGFLKTIHRPQLSPQGASFRQWCLRTFGEGISKHFMFPYNAKLWRTDLSSMTTEWQGRFVPKPTPEEVLYGALTDQKKFFGYNATFRYPVRGGIQALPDALARRIRNIRLGCRVTRVHERERVAEVEGLGEVRYERLVNTTALAQFVDLLPDLPAEVRCARRNLKWNTVYNLNLGVNRRITDKHWVYFPEARYPFYRVGFSSNFSAQGAPRGATGIYVEVSRRPEERVDLNRLEGQILSGLRACGILKSSDKLLARVWLPIPCAYVVYDLHRTAAVHTLFNFLKRHHIESIGRYGAWKYSFMEETILDGKRCAERLSGLGGQSLGKKDEGELQPLK